MFVLKKALLTLLLCTAAAMQSNCYKTVYHSPKAAPGIVHEGTNQHFIGGLINESIVDAQQLCPKGIAQYRYEQSFVDGLIGFLTMGLYTPASWSITCAADLGERNI